MSRCLVRFLPLDTKFMKRLLAVIIGMYIGDLKASETEYKLQAGDSVVLTVFQEGDLDKQVTIDRAGYASFNLIRNIKLEGLTVSQAEKVLIDLYEADYLVSAQLNLEVVNYAKKWIIIVGDVATPGAVDLGAEGQLKLSSAMTRSGGVLQGSTKGKVFVERANGEVETHRLTSIGNLVVSHGDMVTVRLDALVEKAKDTPPTVTVAGHVARPGQVDLPSEGKLDIITAIALAGDFTRYANTRTVTVRRPVGDNGFRTIVLRMKDIAEGDAQMFHVQKGDIIVVKERTF